MGEVQPTTRFSAELSEATFLKVWHDIGESALGKRVTVSISDRTETPPNPGDIVLAPETKYNPDSVSWVEDPETGRSLAIVTEDDAYNSPASNKYFRTLPTRVIRALVKARTNRSKKSNTADYVFENTDTEVSGLIADKLPELIEKLEAEEMWVSRISHGSVEYLKDLYDSTRIK